MVRITPNRNASGRRWTFRRRRGLHPFLYGVASIFDFTGSLRERLDSEPPEVRTTRAIGAAWESVGDALRTVMEENPPEKLREDIQQGRNVK